MTPQFKSGDVVIIVTARHPQFIGREATVVSFDKDLSQYWPEPIYHLDVSSEYVATESQLKKKPPDDQQKGIPDSIRQIFTKTQKDPGYTPEKPLRKKEEA